MFSGIGGFELGIQRAYNLQSEDAQLQMESSKCCAGGYGKTYKMFRIKP